MRTAVLNAPGSIEIVNAADPVPKSTEVLVRIKYCGICTLEQRLYSGEMKIYYPIIPGHEASGIVEYVGDDVITSIKPGDHVAIDMVYRCHECYYCRRGQSNMCLNRFDRRLKPLGGFSELASLKPEQLYKVPSELPLEQAAFTEPLACCIRSLKKIDLQISEDLLIIGAGPMGLMHLKAALAMGARVTVSDVNDARLALASEMGADFTVNPSKQDIVSVIMDLTGGVGADACVVASPAFSALENAFSAIRKDGRVNIYTAYTMDKPALPVDLNFLHRNEITVTGTEGRTETDFLQASRMLSFGKIDVKPLISRIIGFDGLEDGIKAAMSPDTQRVLLGTEL